MSDNYYEILGVTKQASEPEIKSSYRKLALQYHPDRNPGDKSAEEKFKKISEAYAVLSDTEKRRQYDMFGSNQFHQKYSTEDIFRGADFSSIFNEFGGGSGGGGAGFDIFSQLFGFGGGPAGGRGGFRGGPQASPRGEDAEYEVEVGFMEAYQGSERRIQLRMRDNSERDLKLKIPAGIESAQKLRLAGKGYPSMRGGEAGDLYVKINVSTHPSFRREGSDIEVNLALKLSQAMLGTSASIPTPDGNKTIKVPGGVKHGTKIRVRGLGFPKQLGKVQDRGDLFAVVELKLPSQLTLEQQNAVEALQRVGL